MKLEFERVFCINLNRRPDRWSRFVSSIPSDWPFGKVHRVSAIDGNRCHAPGWWSVGNYAWACYKSHVNLIEQCLNQGINSCLILEDDAVCAPRFAGRVRRFASELPSDWQMIYLGGQHLDSRQNPPLRLSEQVYIPYDINRCHAYALRGATALEWYYKHLNKTDDWQSGHHVDHHAGRAHQQRTTPIYCPAEWLIGQDEGQSDICGKDLDVRFFPSARSYLPQGQRLTIVLSSSWKSTRILNSHLAASGFFLVDHLVGWNHPSGRRTAALISAMNRMLRNSAKSQTPWRGHWMGQLAGAIRSCFVQARRMRKQVALNHPALCLIAPTLSNMFPNQLNLISLSETERLTSGTQQAQLERAKQEFLSVYRDPVTHIEPRFLEELLAKSSSRDSKAIGDRSKTQPIA